MFSGARGPRVDAPKLLITMIRWKLLFSQLSLTIEQTSVWSAPFQILPWRQKCLVKYGNSHVGNLRQQWLSQIAKLVKSTPLSPTFFVDFYYGQITSQGSQLWGELKLKTCPLVEGYFGFESGLNRKIVAKNRETAENLKDGKGFIYKVVIYP